MDIVLKVEDLYLWSPFLTPYFVFKFWNLLKCESESAATVCIHNIFIHTGFKTTLKRCF